MNLKRTIRRHLKSEIHTEQFDLWKAKEETEEKLKSKNKTAGMRLARIAFKGYKDGSSLRDFEKEVLLAVQNGLDMGEINNSKEFQYLGADYRCTTTRIQKLIFLRQV